MIEKYQDFFSTLKKLITNAMKFELNAMDISISKTQNWHEKQLS